MLESCNCSLFTWDSTRTERVSHISFTHDVQPANHHSTPKFLHVFQRMLREKSVFVDFLMFVAFRSFQQRSTLRTRTVDVESPKMSVPAASLEPVAEVVLAAAVAAQPRSFHRRISGKFTQKLAGEWMRMVDTWQVMRELYASFPIDQGKKRSLKMIFPAQGWKLKHRSVGSNNTEEVYDVSILALECP